MASRRGSWDAESEVTDAVDEGVRPRDKRKRPGKAPPFLQVWPSPPSYPPGLQVRSSSPSYLTGLQVVAVPTVLPDGTPGAAVPTALPDGTAPRPRAGDAASLSLSLLHMGRCVPSGLLSGMSCIGAEA